MNRVLVFACLLASATVAEAQSLAQRVSSAPDGEVRITYPARPGVCGNGNQVIVNRETGARGNREWQCVPGPVRVALQVDRGQVVGLRSHIGEEWKAEGGRVTDLGTVAPAAAASYLLALAETAEPGVAKKAVFPATLAEGVTVWRDLLRIARNPRAPEPARSQAVFWLGQAAGEEATRGLSELVGDDGVTRSVQEQAVFALSQRPRDEGVPALIRVARTHRDPQIRKKALFWLGQSGDPRALAVFEEILTRS